MVKRVDDKFVISCDRCNSVIDRFVNERGYELLKSSLIKICESCISMLSERHIAAIKVRLKTGVIYSEISSGDDKEVKLKLSS